MHGEAVYDYVHGWLEDYWDRGGWAHDNVPNAVRLNPLDFEAFADYMTSSNRLERPRPYGGGAIYLNTPLGQVEVVRDVWVEQGTFLVSHDFGLAPIGS